MLALYANASCLRHSRLPRHDAADAMLCRESADASHEMTFQRWAPSRCFDEFLPSMTHGTPRGMDAGRFLNSISLVARFPDYRRSAADVTGMLAYAHDTPPRFTMLIIIYGRKIFATVARAIFPPTCRHCLPAKFRHKPYTPRIFSAMRADNTITFRTSSYGTPTSYSSHMIIILRQRFTALPRIFKCRQPQISRSLTSRR